MTTRIALGKKLYAALNAGDTETLTSLLSEDFVGDLTPGLPNGFGASPYVGRESMLRDGWGHVGQYFAMGPQVEEILEARDYIIGRGQYVGRAVESGKPVEARFAHFWRVDGEVITGVIQVTDSAAWVEGLK